jgi:AraC family ethanolamine operon transcriptional activator
MRFVHRHTGPERTLTPPKGLGPALTGLPASIKQAAVALPLSRSPSSTIPAGACGRVDLDDFDAVATVNTVFTERYTQIGRGRATVRAALATTSRMQIVSVSRSPGVRIQGASTAATSLLAIPIESPALHIQGVPGTAGTLAHIPPAREYEILSALPHRMLAVAVDPARLDAAARARWGVPMPGTRAGPFFRSKDPAAVLRAARTWGRWLVAGMRDPGMLLDPQAAERMEEEVLGAYLDAVDPEPRDRPVTPRRELARRAEAFIRASLGEPTRIDDICSAVNASTRALHNAFKQVYGIPPKTYQKALRLAAVRKELLEARTGATVSATAVKWGFFQFGYFAMDYRRMFGEGPRETLHRARAGRRTRPAVIPDGLVRERD